MIFHDIKWVFFDIGGVILDESSFLQWRQNNDLSIIKKYDPGFTMKDLGQKWSVASSIDGSLDTNIVKLCVPSKYYTQACKELLESQKFAPDYYDQPIRKDALLVVEELSKKYKLGIIANQSVKAQAKLATNGLLKYFHKIEMSEHLKVDKPNLLIFEKVLKSSVANPIHSVMIDDNIERGLVPAKKFGMKTIWYKLEERRDANDVVDAVVVNLIDLLDYL